MRRLFFIVSCIHLLLFLSCANMGQPDGGWYDETPPRIVRSTPAEGATGVKAQKISLYFNEYIKVTDAQNNVIVSPPQLEMPEIKEGGKRITVELKDSLKDNTTYTIDFGDAIADNNENNPLGNYAFTFSTGDHIDTMQVSGYVLDASNLEPIKGIMVGLYNNLSDTIFRHEPMMRISRTDSRGHFIVKGVEPGTYRAYALQDADGDYVYGQKSEMIAFDANTFEPSWKPDTRQDTIWRDSLHIASILTKPYTHFLPDDITLLAFSMPLTDRYLIKTERLQPTRMDFYFSYGSDKLPSIRGLNFNSDDAFVVEYTPKRDTVYYWLRDTALVNQDTLRMEANYMMTDTAGILFDKTDTLEIVSKQSYAKRQKELEKEIEKWQKEQDKKKKKGELYDSIYPVKPLDLKMGGGNMAPDGMFTIESQTPLKAFSKDVVHLYSKIDSLWYNKPFAIYPREGNNRIYDLVAEWEMGGEYSVEIDSGAISDIYGRTINAIKQGVKIGKESDYGTLAVTLSGIRDTGIVVQLLSSNGGVVKQTRLSRPGTAYFFYLRPATYYLRAYVDANGNNQWDTGDYDAGRQAEAMYYYPQEAECKQQWDIKLNWNLTARPRFEQKPAAITKQKPEEQKRKLQNRNAERAKKLGKEYIQQQTGVKL